MIAVAGKSVSRVGWCRRNGRGLPFYTEGARATGGVVCSADQRVFSYSPATDHVVLYVGRARDANDHLWMGHQYAD